MILVEIVRRSESSVDSRISLISLRNTSAFVMCTAEIASLSVLELPVYSKKTLLNQKLSGRLIINKYRQLLSVYSKCLASNSPQKPSCTHQVGRKAG